MSCDHTDTGGDSPVMTDRDWSTVAEAKKHQALLGILRSWLTPCFRTPSFCKRTHFCCLRSPSLWESVMTDPGDPHVCRPLWACVHSSSRSHGAVPAGRGLSQPCSHRHSPTRVASVQSAVCALVLFLPGTSRSSPLLKHLVDLVRA